MTLEEAIEELNHELLILECLIEEVNSFICDCDVDDDEYDDEKEQCEISLTRYKKEKEVIEMAISAIKELQQYREIGTVEECREATEKQKAKKLIPINYKEYIDKVSNAEFLEDAYWCPSCKTYLRSGRYCNGCGQKLNWKEKWRRRKNERD